MDERTRFPDDENGDVPRRIQANGDFNMPRGIDFVVVFPDQSSAEAFATQVGPVSDSITIEETHTAENFP